MSPARTTEPALPVLLYTGALRSPSTFTPLLRETLLKTGFFYLSDLTAEFPAWERDWDAAFDASRQFFDESTLEQKEQIAMIKSPHFRGWSGVGSERTMGRIDLREQLDLGPDTPASATRDPIYLSLYGPNQWPSRSLEDSITAYRNHLETIARVVVQRIAESLTAEPSLFTAPFTSSEATPPYSRMKVVSYPPSDPNTGQGCGAHCDGGGLTLLAQDSSGGLQVQRWDTGEWIDVVPRKYDLVVNVGQVIDNLSQNLYTSTTHRVLAVPPSAPRSRLSIPFFFSPSLVNRLPPVPIASLHPELQELVKKGRDVKSEVQRGDLSTEGAEFGQAAWKGITRSHVDVWTKYYSDDTLGGPQKIE